MFVVATSLLGLPLGHGLLGGWGWLSALSVPGRVITAVTPLDSLWDLVRGVTPYHLVRGRHVLQPGPDQLLLKYLRVAALAATASVVVVAAASVRRIGPIRASGLALFSVVLLGVVVWPWYLLWPVVLLAVAGRRAERLAVAAVSVLLLFVDSPGGPTLWGSPGHWPGTRPAEVVTLMVAASLALLIVGGADGSAVPRRLTGAIRGVLGGARRRGLFGSAVTGPPNT